MGGVEQQLVERRWQELQRAGGGSAFVVVHADGVDSVVLWVEDGPGPWVGRARALVGSATPQGVADLVDGVVRVAAPGLLLRG